MSTPGTEWGVRRADWTVIGPFSAEVAEAILAVVPGGVLVHRFVRPGAWRPERRPPTFVRASANPDDDFPAVRRTGSPSDTPDPS